MRSGTLANNQPYAVYRITVPFNHTGSQLEAIFSASNVNGLANQGFGIDNIQLHVNPIPPQTFDVTLPASISDATPAAGAGNLETRVSKDSYQFAIGDGHQVAVELSHCPYVGVSWALVNDTGATVQTGSGCNAAHTDALMAGTYRLDVTAYFDATGTYQLNLYTVPAPQTFNVTLPAAISNAVPAAGAGNLETKSSKDSYRFTVADGDQVAVETANCPYVGVNWALVNETTGAIARTGSGCNATRTDSLTAGTYRLDVAPEYDAAGTYQLNLYTVPAPQAFTVSLPAVISNGVPAAGAGNLETKASRDSYRFTVADGDQVAVDTANCPYVGVNWALVNDSTGATVKTGSGCNATRTDPLTTGTYRLDVTAEYDAAGTYQLNLYTVPAPQAFTVTLPTAISNGVPAAGAGNLETKASTDSYRFSVADGDQVAVETANCPYVGVNWALVNETTGATLKTGSGCNATRTDPLTAGTYRLDVTPEYDAPGTYQLNLYVLPAPQTFDVTLPATTSNGVPAAGAGNLETKASKDSYRFTLADGVKLAVETVNCPYVGVNWALVNDSTGATVKTGSGCNASRTDALSAGTYRLDVTPEYDATGTYQLTLYAVPAPQTFDVTLPATISDGVPGAGAGNLETMASEDDYRFTVADGNSVTINAQSCPFSYGNKLAWTLINDSIGATVKTGNCGNAQTDPLPAGTYRLKVRPQDNTAGTYQMQVTMVASSPPAAINTLTSGQSMHSGEQLLSTNGKARLTLHVARHRGCR